MINSKPLEGIRLSLPHKSYLYFFLFAALSLILISYSPPLQAQETRASQSRVQTESEKLSTAEQISINTPQSSPAEESISSNAQNSVFMRTWIKIQNYVFIILGLFVVVFLFSLLEILKKRAWKRIGILLFVVIMPALFEGIGRFGILVGIPLLENLSFMTNEYARFIFVFIIVFAILYSRLGFHDIHISEEKMKHLNEKLKGKVEEQTKEISFLLDATVKTSQTQDLKEIIKLFSEMLIRSFACHTFSRVAIMDKSKKIFELKHISCLRPLKIDSMLDRDFSIDDFTFLKKAVSCQDIQMVAIDSAVIDDNEKKFLFQDQFKTVLILPFIHGKELLGFGMVCEARSPDRSSFSKADIEFYKTLANHIGVSIHNAQLFSKNKTIFLNTIQALAAAVDARDTYTLDHSRNVTDYAVKIAEEMNLQEEQITTLKTAGLLHDIGKIGIKDEVLLKSGKLTEKDFNEFATHPSKAVKILDTVEELNNVTEIIAAHHERYDGKGYPNKLEGENIPLEARIIAVADTYDAITTSRTYRKPVKKEKAIEEIKKCSGTQFDPQVVEAFLNIVPLLPPDNT
jgi:putative nucleotidyltransferase with HDIG domain